jgi:SAM-dependent methyltransferase
MTLRLPDTGAQTLPDGRRVPPSAQRNADPILHLLQQLAPQGRLLEIASGSGLHAAHCAPHLPDVLWQPTDIAPENLTSITAWTAGLANVLPALVFDASQPDWPAQHRNQNAILLVNLLHLIPAPAAKTLLTEAARALAPGGVAVFYGPYLRDGQTTSAGDATFHASLQAQDPSIGYKDQAWVTACLMAHGLTVTAQPMPANNLSLIARKPL